MKKIGVVQSLLRLVVALLVMAMLFLPWFSVKVMSLTEERVAQITALGLIAVDRGDMTEEEFAELLETMAPIAEEAALIVTGETPDGEKLPFDFSIETKYPEYLVDSSYPEQMADLLYPAQSEIGSTEEKKEISFSVFSFVKSLISGGVLTGRLITTDILEDGELENTEGMSEEQIAETLEQIAKNKEECGFSEALLGKLAIIGVVNSETWVYLSKIDTSNLSAEVMDLVWFASSFTSFTVIASLLLIVIAAISLFMMALVEIFKLIVKKFSAKGAKENCALFQYCSPVGMILAVVFLNTGAKASPLLFVLLGVCAVCALAFSFMEGAAKQGGGCGLFFWGVRIISILAIAACLVAGYVGLNTNAFETIVTDEAYAQSFSDNVEKQSNRMDPLNEQLLLLLEEEEKNPDVDNSESIAYTTKSIELLNAEIQYDSANDVMNSLLFFKLLIMVYLILVAGYFTTVVSRLGAMRSTEYPHALVLAKYPGCIVYAILAAVAEILLFDGLVTPFVYFFAAMAVLEIILAIFKKVSRKSEYSFVVSRGQALCDAGVVPTSDWEPVYTQLKNVEEKATSISVVGFLYSVDLLLSEYELGEVSLDELGKKMKEACSGEGWVPQKKKK